MEKNYSSTDRSAVFDRALSLPHFDEEATLLSARPVVPLHEVKPDTRSKRGVIFGLTILVAILVGAISASMLMPSGQNSPNALESELSQPAVSSSGAAGGASSGPPEVRVPVASKPDEEPQMVIVPSPRDFSIKKRPAAIPDNNSIKPTSSRNSTRPARPDNETVEDFDNDEWELRRAERRDARRETRRELRRRREQIGDDVLRIREIFEGSPRP